jgi:hypothetical protein
MYEDCQCNHREGPYFAKAIAATVNHSEPQANQKNLQRAQGATVCTMAIDGLEPSQHPQK